MRLRSKKTMSIVMIAAILFTLLLPAAVWAEEPPSVDAMSFYYGTLKAQGNDGVQRDVAKGAVIKAYYTDSEGQKIEVGSLVTVEDGKYGALSGGVNKLMINGSSILKGGEKVTIFVNGIEATTITFTRGTTNELPLVITGETVSDIQAPVISSLQPAEGSTVSNTKKPVISAALSDSGTGVNSAATVLKLDGNTISSAQKSATGVTYTPAADLAAGSHTVIVTAYDMAGNKAEKTWSFTLSEPVSPTAPPSPPPSNPPSTPSTPSTPASTPAVITTPASIYNESITQTDGTELFTKPVTVDGTKAAATLTAEDIKSALDAITAGEDGIKTAIITMPEIKRADSFTQNFPAEALAGEAAVRFILKAGITSLELTGDMFAAADMGEAKSISITLAKGDTAGLDAAAAKEIGKRPVINWSIALDGEEAVWNSPDTSVNVSVKYAPSRAELLDPEHIVVKYIHPENRLIAIPTGKYIADEGVVTFKTTLSGTFAISYVKKTFTDIGKFTWAKKSIEVLASKGVISGTSTTTFNPERDITRADFVSLLIRAFGLNATFESNYSDVPENAYYYQALGIAKQLGIIGEMPDNNFMPNEKLTREDMMVFTAKVLEIAGKLVIDGTEADLEGYTDASQVAPEALPYVASLVKAGIIKGDGIHINPKANASRGEMAAVIYRIYNL